MLYVFLVGSGTMVTFDMSLACGNVAALQNEISEKCMIPRDQQVLLVSGGAALDPSSKVIKYSAGTDTNPIFLCTRTGIDGMGTYLDDDMGLSVSMSERVRACENMAADQQTLAVRTQLAQDMAEQANNEYTICSQLVDSQHLQHQGWLAVIANLEDELKSLNKTYEVLESNAQEYFRSRPLYHNLLNNFHAAITKLDKIPVLPALLAESNDSTTDCHSLLTLFTRPEISLSDIAAQCQRWVEHLFNESTIEMLTKEVEKVLKDSKETDMREIAGIEEWLFNLNKRLSDAKEIAVGQCQRAKSFLIKHGRLNSKDEASTVMLLCTSHLEQLKQMLCSHNSLIQVRDHCSNAKRRLSENLQVRISWVACIENRIFDLKNKLVIYNLSLVRFRLHLEMIQQMHVAPEIYAKSLVEVRRRKSFSDSYLKWASCISEHAAELRDKEVNARNAFQENKTTNFVDSLFPGMDDFPPQFATPCPEPFDELLPTIKQEDLDKLKQLLPDLTAILDVPPPPDIIPQISAKSIVSDSAFSSEVPSSNVMGGRSMSSASLRSCHLCRTATMSSSMAAEVSNLPEVSSPVSSPSEDFPGKPKTSSEDSKVVPEKETFSPIAEEQNNVESDGDEFERVDNVPKCVYDPFDSKPTSDESSSKMSKSGDITTKPAVERMVPLPSAEDRLQSPDSMVTSHDFHSTDYFFDDSMPSSYTESTGVSAVGKGQQHLVKSHHIIVAELQQQLSDKTVAVESMQGCSHGASRPADLMQLHGTISAFQKYIQEIRKKTTSDLNSVRELIVAQRCVVDHQINIIKDEVTATVTHAQTRNEVEKLKAIEEATNQECQKNKAYLQSIELQLEVETNKLWDMSREVQTYQGEIQNLRSRLDDREHSFKQQLQEVHEQHRIQLEELRKEMEVEHELELSGVKSLLEQKIKDRDERIFKLLKDLEDKQTRAHMLEIEKENLQIEHKEQLAREFEKWSLVSEVKKTDVAVQCVDNEVVSSTAVKSPTLPTPNISSPKPYISSPKEELCAVEYREMLHGKEDAQSKISNEDFLNFALKNEKMFVPLYYELCRLWNTLYIDFGGNRFDTFADIFTRKMDEQVMKVVENPPKVKNIPEESSSSCVGDSEKLLIGLMEKISEFSANKDVRNIEELLKTNDRLVEICLKSAEHFQTWGPSNVYTQRFLKTTDEAMEESRTEIAKLQDELGLLEAKHIDEIERLKSIHIAEKQISFNEVYNKVSSEKDDVISVLNNEVAALEEFQKVVRSVFCWFLEQYKANSEATGDCPHQIKDIYKVILQMKKKIEEPKTVTSPSPPTKVTASLLVTRMKELEKELKKERAKLTKIFEKVSKADNVKLALSTCDPGDVVLFCFNEKHNSYVAFYFGKIPHFLHSEGVKMLKLQIPPEGASTSWGIGVITEKQYYVARKKPNRYNVKYDSVFYCVKAQPWKKGEEMRRLFEPETQTEMTPQAEMASSEVDLDQPSTSGIQMENSAI